MSESDNWRGIDVKRESNHKALESILVNGNDSMFPLLKDLMVFAASIGHSMGQRTPLQGDAQGITLGTYNYDGKDGYIYLFGLLESKNGESLRMENLKETIKIYEEFCNAGLYEIQKWLDNNPSDPSGTDTILNKMLEKITQIESSTEIDPTDIDLGI
jgi:dnd system-associated protein 4